MSILAVQLNHTGREKPFTQGHGYSTYQGELIREWNSDKSHYRKFLQQSGRYLHTPDQQPQGAELLFWGEWEGNSYFKSLPKPFSGRNPNGIHRPFHSLHELDNQNTEPNGCGNCGPIIDPLGTNLQNTDPYVFGDRFYYAVCKQRGRLTQLEPGSLILFGSSYKEGFALDTVFVVGSYETAQDVAATNARNYSETYRQQTLDRLGNAYTQPQPNPQLRLYAAQMYEQHQTYFSYVPCRPASGAGTAAGFERLMFAYDDPLLNFSSNPRVVKFLGEGQENTRAIWEAVTRQAIKNNYQLGVFLKEPELSELP